MNRLEQRLALLAGGGDEHDVAALHARGIAGDDAGKVVDSCVVHLQPPRGRSARRCP